MSPWPVLVAFTAALNLLVFIWFRGRWGRIVLPLAVASVVGTVAGDAAGGLLRLSALQIGSFHLLAASILAQLAMLVVVLLGVLGPTRIEIGD